MSSDSVRAGIAGAREVSLAVIEGGKGKGGGGGEQGGSESSDNDAPPILPLGHDEDGAYYFLDPAGFRRKLTFRDITSRGGISGLFGGDVTWLREKWPKKITCRIKDENGDEKTEEKTVDYKVTAAGEGLMSMCFKAGGYDPNRPIRRPGIWRGRDGKPVVHVGDWVLEGEEWRRAGFRDAATGIVWASTVDHHAGPCPRDARGVPVPPAAAEMAGADVGCQLQDDIRELWKLDKRGGEIIALGWLGTALYGAATSWRPNVFFTGGAGSGKSRLVELLAACCPMNVFSTDTTKAGVESALNNTSMPALLDESSDRGDGRAAMNLVDVVLSASSGSGTSGLRGTVDGKARQINVITSVAMAAINAPELQPQHQARFCIVELRAPDLGVDHRAEMDAAVARMREAAPSLWLRVLHAWPRYRAALQAFRAALQRSQCLVREMDQYGALLAGWWVLVEDGTPTDGQALDGVGALNEYVRTAVEVESDGGPQRALRFLASTPVQKDRSTDQETIGALLEKAWDGVTLVGGEESYDRGAAREWLERIGIRPVAFDEGPDRNSHRDPPRPPGAKVDGAWLSKGHRSLDGIFAGQRGLQDGRWKQELRRLPGAYSSPGGVRVAKGVPPTTAIWIPRTAWDPEWTPPPQPPGGA